MFTYRNTRTGVQFVSVSECFGEDIEQVSPPETAPAPEPPPEAPKKSKKKTATK